VTRQNKMDFWIQHNEISKTQLCRFLPQKNSFYLQASVIFSKILLLYTLIIFSKILLPYTLIIFSKILLLYTLIIFSKILLPFTLIIFSKILLLYTLIIFSKILLLYTLIIFSKILLLYTLIIFSKIYTLIIVSKILLLYTLIITAYCGKYITYEYALWANMQRLWMSKHMVLVGTTVPWRDKSATLFSSCVLWILLCSFGQRNTSHEPDLWNSSGIFLHNCMRKGKTLVCPSIATNLSVSLVDVIGFWKMRNLVILLDSIYILFP
jgi:hypothetical protein